VIADADRRGSIARGLRLEYFSLGYNLLEAAVGLFAGIAAGSVALVGFGLDSVAEGASAGVIVWRLRSEVSGRRTPEEAEKRAIKLVGVAFLILAVYVAAGAVLELARGSRPDPSPLGAAIALLSLIVMPLLARGKGVVARELGSRSLEADSHQTILCTYLSAILLVGLLANAVLGWWWADPVAALGIAALAGIEGVELLGGGHAH
jgi:divalent metal cation (Fe/Co/Zn/Cd) transporter